MNDFEVRLRARLAQAAEQAPEFDPGSVPAARMTTTPPRARGLAWLPRLAVAVLAVALLAGLGWLINLRTSPGNGGGAASCAYVVDFQGTRYWARASLAQTPQPGARLGHGTIPACNDTMPRNAEEKDRPVTVHQVPGVDPGIAIMVNHTILIATDPDHPHVLPAELAALNEPMTCNASGKVAGNVLSFSPDSGGPAAAQLPVLELLVDEGAILGDTYVALRIQVGVPGGTDGIELFDDPATAPWRVTVNLRCEGETFIAESIQRG